MSLGSIIRGGIRLVRTQPQIVAAWGAIYFAATIVAMMVMRPWVADITTYQQQAAAGVTAQPVLPSGFLGQVLLLQLIFLVGLAVAFAAVVRAVARPSRDRFAYLRIGMDELRLIGLGLLLAIAALIAESVAVVAVILIGVLISLVAGQTAAAVIAVLLMIALFCGAIYVNVRLSLADARLYYVAVS
jgi:hypothetical protein